MADRIYDLTNEPNPADDVSLIIDHPDWTEARQCSKQELLAGEVTDRTDADNDIKDGAGLNADGSYSPDPGSSYLQNQDFLDAGYDVNARNADRLLDAAIADIAANGEQTWQIDLSSAEILALGTPLTKIPTPGANLHYHFFECDAANFFNSVAYASAGANGIDLIFSGASDYIVRFPQTFLQAIATTRQKFLILGHELYDNTAVQVVAPDGNPVNGDGTISIRLRGIIENAIAYGGAVSQKSCCIQPISDTFVNADLTALGNLVIYHGLNSLNVMAVVYDNTMAQVAVTWTNGDEAGADTYNNITIPIGLGIPGTWRYLLFIS